MHACNLCWYHISILVFHGSNCVSAIKRILFYPRHKYILVFFTHLCAPCYCQQAYIYYVACGSEDVIQYN